MSKVRINALAREMEVKSRQILDVLAELGLATGKTHSSSLEDYEADKVRAQFERTSRSGGQGAGASSRPQQGIQPKIDLSHVSKPGDVLKAILAKKQEAETEARQSHAPARTQPPAVVPAKPVATPAPVAPAAAAPVRPEPRKIVPQPRSAPPIVVAPPAQPAIASRPPSGAVVAKPPAGAVAATRPSVVAAPHVAVVVKPPVAQPATSAVREDHPRAAEKPVAAKAHAAHTTAAHTTTAPAVATPAVHDTAVTASDSSALFASAAEPAALAATTFAEPSEALKETQVSAPVDVDVLELESEVAPPSRSHNHAASPPSAPPVRRMVMPQTGPRPVYKAPIVQPTAVVPGTGNQAAGAG